MASDIPDGVYQDAARAMLPAEGEDLYEWRRCGDCAIQPCACSGEPWPSPPVRAAVESAYRAGRKAALDEEVRDGQ